jgi:hypothetical protein
MLTSETLTCIPDGNLDGYQKKKFVHFSAFSFLLKAKIEKICCKDHIHVYSGVQGRRRTYGGGKPDIQPEI